jgi:glycosyltransferase involved in cell wall biosynthesis
LKKIIFLIDTLENAGAQKVLALYTKWLCDKGHSVAVFSLKDKIEISFDERVAVFCGIPESESITANIFPLMQSVADNVKDFDIVISFMDFITSYIVSAVCSVIGKTYYISCRNMLSCMIDDLGYLPINNLMVSKVYNNAEKVLCVSSDVADDLSDNFNIRKSKLAITPNPIQKIRNKEIKTHHIYNDSFSGKKVFLSVGRLEKQKNHIFLIDAFSRMERDDAGLLIVGSGSMKSKLESRINDYGLSQKVFILDAVEDITSLINGCYAFVLPSLFEGMSNVIGEVINLDIPCFVSDGKSVGGKLKNYTPEAVFPLDNTEKLAKVLDDLDENIIDNIRKKQKSYVDDHCYDLCCQNFFSHFSEVLNR